MSTAARRPSPSPTEPTPVQGRDGLEQLRAAYGADADRLLPGWVHSVNMSNPQAAEAVDAAITDAATEYAAELTASMRPRIQGLISALALSGADVRDYVVLVVDHRSPEAPEEFLEVHPPLSILHVDDLADELASAAATVAASLSEERLPHQMAVVTVTFARLVVDTFTSSALGSA